MSVKLLNAVTATGPSPVWDVRMKPRHHTVEIKITGAPTAVTVALEGSLTKNGFESLADHIMSAEELTAGFALFHVADKVVRAVRANIVLLTGGTAPTVTVNYEGQNA